MPTSSWAAFRSLGPFLQPYRARWAMACASLALVHVVEALAPLLLKLGVDRIARHDVDLTLPVFGILLLAGLRYALLSYGRRGNAAISVDIAADLRRAFFAHVQRQGAQFYARYALGDLMARSANDIDFIRLFFRIGVNHVAAISSVAIVAPLFMAWQSPGLTVLTVALLSGLVAVAALTARKIRGRSARVQAEFSELTDHIQRDLHGVRTIQAHTGEDLAVERFAQRANDYARANIAVLRGFAFLNSLMPAAASASALVIAGVGGAMVREGALSLGALVAFIFYAGMILGVLGGCGAPIFHFLRAATASARLFEIFDEEPEIRDDGGPPRKKIAGALAVEALTFAYPGGVPVLQKLSFTIAPGELIAIHGRIGAGKSSLLRLLARRLDPTAGRILIDDVEIDRFPLGQLREEVAFVTQESFLFSASFAENISYDDPARPEAAIWSAAGAASLDATILRAPLGLATTIGERGVRLSGGQKQRTALARGIIRTAPVLLLDDCFSALDAETEAQIFDEIRHLRCGLTTLFVSHRVSTTRRADRILVLDNGVLVESGSPDVLGSGGGRYAELCAQQASREKEMAQ
jgi:ATP-binding cassette subfamily B multidrug efflux pump